MKQLLYFLTIALFATIILSCSKPRPSEPLSNEHIEDNRTDAKVHTAAIKDENKNNVTEHKYVSPIDSIAIDLWVAILAAESHFIIYPNNPEKGVAYLMNTTEKMAVSDSVCAYVSYICSQIFISKKIKIVESKVRTTHGLTTDYPHISFHVYTKNRDIHEDVRVAKNPDDCYIYKYSTQFDDMFTILYNLTVDLYEKYDPSARMANYRRLAGYLSE
jgi:hypothetical protein